MTTSPVSLPDAVRNAILYQLANIHTAMPAQIVSYDFTTQKASVQPTINKKWTDGTTSIMPIISSVPVIFPSSGGATISFPVGIGDSCLLVVCERSITEWLQEGGLQTPADPRKLNLTDAVAIVGLKPFNANFPARANNTDLIIDYAGSSITITATGAIKINTASNVAIGTNAIELLQQISDSLAAISTAFNALATDATLAPNLLPGTIVDLAAAATAANTSDTNINLIKGTLP